MFRCFFKVQEEDQSVNVEKPIYNTHIDNVFVLKQKIKNDEYQPNEFDSKFLEENEKYLVDDKNNYYIRYMFFYKLCILIDYSENQINVCKNLNELRKRMSLSLKYEVIPVFFQTNRYLDTKEKLNDVLFNKIHLDNIKILNELISLNNI